MRARGSRLVNQGGIDRSARRSACRCERGQASVELLAAVPLILVVVLAIVHVLAFAACRDYAADGAHAGAVALLQDADPRDAARAALPGWSRSSVRVAARGRRVVVRVRPRVLVPGLERVLTAQATADAGPAS